MCNEYTRYGCKSRWELATWLHVSHQYENTLLVGSAGCKRDGVRLRSKGSGGGVMRLTQQRGIVLYRFMDAEGAIATLRSCSLKMSIPNELNDTFEFCPGITGVPAHVPLDSVARCSNAFVDEISKHYGIVSFTSKSNCPLFWSHYASKHEGIALEFGFGRHPDLFRMRYRRKRPSIPFVPLADVSPATQKMEAKVITKCLTTKDLSWRYEDEWRIIGELSKCHPTKDKKGKVIYLNALEPRSLWRVILGMKCPKTESDIEAITKDKNAGLGHVEVVRARMHPSQYRIEIPTST